MNRNRLIDIVSPLLNNKGAPWEPVNELIELDKKYSYTFVGFDCKPFYIEKIGGSQTDDISTIIVFGKMFNSSVLSWVSINYPINHPSWDFTYQKTRFINGKSKVYKIYRLAHKQWKWGLTDKNSKVYSCSVPKDPQISKLSWTDVAGISSLTFVNNLFQTKYPTLKEVLEAPKETHLSSGCALSEDTIVSSGKDCLRFFVGNNLVAESKKATPKKLMFFDPKTPLREGLEEVVCLN